MATSGRGWMLRWAQTAEAIRATRKTSVKASIVAAYLPDLDAADLAIAAIFLSGRAFPERDQRVTGLGWAAISAVVRDVSGADDDALSRAYDRSSDLGTAVSELLIEARHAPSGRRRLTLQEVATGYRSLAHANGRAAKGAVFAQLLGRADPLSARYVTAILSGELRIGLREGLLEKGLALGFERDIAAVQWAHMLSGDIGRTAELARDDALASARLSMFHPLKSMLAAPVVDEQEAMARLRPPIWVEDKYDGVRAQLHKLGTDVRLYSRDLNEVTRQFPEVVRAAAELPWDGILDGEVLAWKDDEVLPFLQLQSRLGRAAPSEAIQVQVPAAKLVSHI
jgi:DNA ligase-1